MMPSHLAMPDLAMPDRIFFARPLTAEHGNPPSPLRR
jgi:hypothetical protein